ncbi:MAG TPA: RNA polymerase sigma factor [Solirubrobacteraceae bacterium]|jgi:RNA polymerase sigma factor (sigma-70 family)|nr:RNA polymerase sigma factor [Solirubrobacteraceae bacterium]
MSAIATLPPSRTARILPLTRLGDEALAARAAAGNTAAFSELCERYHAPLLGYCRSILLNDDDANDAVQAALENALRALPRKEPGRPLRPWLYRIAHNESINVVRKRNTHAELTELDEPSVPGPEVDSEHRVRLAQLVDDLRGLPERQRGALVMRELSGLSYDEIAVALNVSNEAARRAVFDARNALHEAVDGRATDCVNVRHCISDGDRRSLRARRIRAHLRSCNDCASFQQAIHARSADLHLLGPWLSGAAFASMLGGGAGGGALIAAGGGGAATVTVASWSSMPVLLKGLTVAAVVATTGGAAAEIKHVSKPHAPAPKTQAAVPRATPAASPTAAALAPKAIRISLKAAPTKVRARAAHASSSRGSVGSTSLAGAIVTRRGSVATAPVVAPPAPTPTVTQHQPAPEIKKAPVQAVKSKLTDFRQQVLDAVANAQTIAQSGTSGALALATSTLQSTLAGLGTTIDKVLAQFGLKLPETVATPTAPTTTTPSAPSLPTTVLAPVQSLLNGVDSLLSQLLGRRAG